ncbi:hypothetical protein VOLCADRAFT_74811 [Volvox carteri f. nagariensis]|uniref:Serine aminopeptidase S33 domain-containing protein n=1 Tax=Volvox carteri f. nagariensis TaxID=3068 RepID=D8TWV2_VOLCA|nr:uncharacterized protein VOLCADRAFT_74811 [Volvox carteri f. nagariensis]EFJ48216.1 hypothetical protein VOLCADRAFT_74811 [Volvox carteri f. nagariensis]|eukprot:XP_002950901.1 hypothetical protein VOLCADRAFT_74811 [Volvox carteri f. nagariensis]
MSEGSQTQTLSFGNFHSERLAAKFMDVGSDGVVILCHGYASTKDGFLFPRLAEELAARGLSSLRFDFAGNGESEGTFSFGNYFREVEDLRAAVQFVRDILQKSVHAIIGHSKGGNVVLLYASRYGDVPYVVNVAGRGVMSRGIKERFGADIMDRLAEVGAVEQEVRQDGGRRIIKYLLTKQRMQLDMLSEAAKISRGSQVLTIHGSSDTVVPVDDARRLAGVMQQCRHTLVVVDGADHNFRPPMAAARLIELVLEYLAGPESAETRAPEATGKAAAEGSELPC